MTLRSGDLLDTKTVSKKGGFWEQSVFKVILASFIYACMYVCIVDLQCCVSFWCTAVIHLYIFFFIFFSIMVYYRILDILPYAIQ